MRDELLKMAQRLFKEGLLTGISGNLSVYDADTEIMTITPTSVPYDEMEVDDIVCIKPNGERITGRHKPSSEWPMHAAIYKERSDIKAIIHTHCAYATSFALNKNAVPAIPVVLIEMVPMLGGNVFAAEFALPGTAELGQNALSVLKDRNACLLANHGTLTIGQTLQQAYLRTVCLEEVAKIYSLAISNGHVNVINDKIVQQMQKSILQRHG
jgi:ribulose-5-phosphate 4-epimerase/fuculose-1-phosphate aldolase